MAAKKKKSKVSKKPSKKSPVGSKKPGSKKPAAKKAGSKKAKSAKPKKPAVKKTAAKKKAVSKKPTRMTKVEAAADARVSEIQRIIDVMTAAGAVEVELEEAGCKLRVRLREEPSVSMIPMAASQVMAPMAAHSIAVPAVDAAPAAPAEDPNRNVFKSPMVGTFYTAASPDAEPYAHVGTRVNEESTICILEAMKVMNEIKAETNGEIVEILVQNGEAVEFGQPLFVIKS